MSDFTIAQPPSEPTPAIEIHLYSADADGFAVVIGLAGDHDLASAPALADTLRQINGNARRPYGLPIH
jgi:hypothetical protein